MQVLLRREEPKQAKLKQTTLARFLASQIVTYQFEKRQKQKVKPISNYVRILCEACLTNKDYGFASFVVSKEPLIFGRCENCGSTRNLYLVTLKKSKNQSAERSYVYNGLRTCGQCEFYEPVLKRCKIYKNLWFLSPHSTLARSCPYFEEVL
jgi:formate dehydrogenase maturation protein FdhE